MERREFLKLIGIASVALTLPLGVEMLIKQVEGKNYDEQTLRELFGDICKHLSEEEWEYLRSLQEEYTLYQVNSTRTKVTTDMNRKRKQFAGKQITVLGTAHNVFEASIKQREYDKQIELSNNYKQQPYFWMRVRIYRGLKPDARIKQAESLSKNFKHNVHPNSKKLNKEQVLELKQTYQANPGIALSAIAVLYGTTAETARLYLTNSHKINYGEPVTLHRASRNAVDKNDPQAIINFIKENKCVYKTDVAKCKGGQPVYRAYRQMVKDGVIEPMLKDNRGKQGQQVNAGYYTSKNRKWKGSGSKEKTIFNVLFG